MFKLVVGILLMCSFSKKFFAQENMGIINDNYVPIQGLKLNPTAIVDQKPWLSIQLMGLSAYGRNNFAYLPNTTYTKANFNNIDYNYNRNKYNGYINIEAQGPAASLVLGKYSIAIHSGIRGMVNIKNIPGELGEIIANENVSSITNGTYNTNNSRVKAMAWGEIGATFGGIVFQKGEHMITSAISINRLFGLANANVIVKNANLSIVNEQGTLNNLNGKFSYSDFSTKAGKGWGTSLGVTYKKMKDDVTFYIPHSNKTNCFKPNYKYKIGASLIDLGYIKFTQNAKAGEFNETLDVDDVDEISNASDVSFLNEKSKFTSVLPSALSLQFDYNVNDKIYLNTTAIQKLHHSSLYSAERDNLLSVGARFESKWIGVGLPFVLQNYKHPQMGLALRLGPLNIGTDHLLPFLFKTDVYAADIYFSLKFNIMKSPSCKEKKVKKPKSKRRKKLYCPAWN